MDKFWLIVSVIVLGLTSLLSVALSAHGQYPQYCPSGAVVTYQSQCPSAVGPIDPVVKSILSLNNSGVNSTSNTTFSLQRDNKSSTNEQTAQPAIRHSNMTVAGNMTAGSQQLLSPSQLQTPNTIPSILLDGIFQNCFRSSLSPTVRSMLNSADVAAMEKEAIQNMTSPIPFKPITNNSAFDQSVYNTNAKVIKRIADCMRQGQTGPLQQLSNATYPYQQPQPNSVPPYQQHPNSNYPYQQPPYSFQPYQQPPLSMTQYTDPERRFTISYPTTWSGTPATNRFQGNALTIRAGPDSGVLVQIVDNTSPPLSPESFARYMKQGMYGFLTFQDVECSKYKVDGNMACSFIVTKSSDPSLGTPSVAFIAIITSINGKTYIFDMGSSQDRFDSVLPLFETMVHSFKAGSSSSSASTSTGTINPQQSPSPSYPYQRPPTQQQIPQQPPSQQQPSLQPQLQQGQPLYNPNQVVACLNHVLVDRIVKAGTTPDLTLHNNSKGAAPELNQTFIENATQTLDSCIIPIGR